MDFYSSGKLIVGMYDIPLKYLTVIVQVSNDFLLMTPTYASNCIRSSRILIKIMPYRSLNCLPRLGGGGDQMMYGTWELRNPSPKNG